LDRWNCRTV